MPCRRRKTKERTTEFNVKNKRATDNNTERAIGTSKALVIPIVEKAHTCTTIPRAVVHSSFDETLLKKVAAGHEEASVELDEESCSRVDDCRRLLGVHDSTPDYKTTNLAESFLVRFLFPKTNQQVCFSKEGRTGFAG